VKFGFTNALWSGFIGSLIVFVIGAVIWSTGLSAKPLTMFGVFNASAVAFIFIGLFGGFGLGRKYSE
jgi:hypothetical protein